MILNCVSWTSFVIGDSVFSIVVILKVIEKCHYPIEVFIFPFYNYCVGIKR